MNETVFLFRWLIHRTMVVSAVVSAVVGMVVLILVNRAKSPHIPKYSNALGVYVSSLVQQSRLWHGLAKSRDSGSNSALRLVYASRAMAYLSVARRMMLDKEIARTTGVDVENLLSDVQATERFLMFTVDGSTETAVGWLYAMGSN